VKYIKLTIYLQTALKAKSTYKFQADATYVIAGGLGGLGRTVARWLVSRGAKHILLLSRSGVEKNKRGKGLVSEFRAKGVQIETPVCNVSNLGELQMVIKSISAKMPPIKGCILSQMVIRVCYLNPIRSAANEYIGLANILHAIRCLASSGHTESGRILEYASHIA
jgi:NAD(P)-dependent dehydrogenase (short-subunit alcohol dehydrogenase family)